MSEAEIALAARKEIYLAMFQFARSQGATETEALVYAASWDGVVTVTTKEPT